MCDKTASWQSTVMLQRMQRILLHHDCNSFFKVKTWMQKFNNCNHNFSVKIILQLYSQSTFKSPVVLYTVSMKSCRCVFECCTSVCVCVVTQWGVHRDVDGQDVLVNQFDGTRSVGDLVVEVIGQSRSLQLQLLGLQGRLCRRFCRGHNRRHSMHANLFIEWFSFICSSNKITPGTCSVCKRSEKTGSLITDDHWYRVLGPFRAQAQFNSKLTQQQLLV